jgi:hypothetical protein
MKLQMKREALAESQANDKGVLAQERPREVVGTVLAQLELKWRVLRLERSGKSFVFRENMEPPAGLNRRPADYETSRESQTLDNKGTAHVYNATRRHRGGS